MAWTNSDGLRVKFGAEEGSVAKGGEVMTMDNICSIHFNILAADMQSATAAILGSVGGTTYNGSNGIQVPEGARILGLDVLTQTAFTSTGTIATASLQIGLKKWSDFSTELDHDGFATTSFVGDRMDAVGERTYIEVGTTGAGALIGTTLSEDGVISVTAAGHATHPFAAGVLKCRLDYYYPGTSS